MWGIETLVSESDSDGAEGGAPAAKARDTKLTPTKMRGASAVPDSQDDLSPSSDHSIIESPKRRPGTLGQSPLQSSASTSPTRTHPHSSPLDFDAPLLHP